MNRQMRAAGYPSEVISDAGLFLVQVPGLASEADARGLMGNLREVEGVKQPLVKEMGKR
jgi:hypothetical protein